MKFDLHNIFSPSQEILDPERFAGRKESVAMAVKALCRPGSSIVVYGERGAGKTSFVEMIKLIAQDQVELIHRYRLHQLKPLKGFQYKVVSIECDEDVDCTEKVLQRLITSPEGFSGFLGPRIEKIETTVKDKYTIGLVKNLLSKSMCSEEKISLGKVEEKSIYEQFTNLVLFTIQEVLGEGEGLLIVVDEFDRVSDSSKMSSLIKTLSKNKVKFLLCGIADNYHELLQGHASIMRQLFQGTIKISPMEVDEVFSLFRLVEEYTNSEIIFDKKFIDEVIFRSKGYPYYVQMFGQIALDHAVFYESGKKLKITRENLISGLKTFSTYDPVMDDIYLKVIGNDSAKEIILKSLAIQLPVRIQEALALKYCEKRGLKNPRKYLTQLLGNRDPQIIKRIDKGYVTFVDPLFKVFASNRDIELIDNMEEVE